jgi:hypothetical protein
MHGASVRVGDMLASWDGDSFQACPADAPQQAPPPKQHAAAAGRRTATQQPPAQLHQQQAAAPNSAAASSRALHTPQTSLYLAVCAQRAAGEAAEQQRRQTATSRKAPTDAWMGQARAPPGPAPAVAGPANNIVSSGGALGGRLVGVAGGVRAAPAPVAAAVAAGSTQRPTAAAVAGGSTVAGLLAQHEQLCGGHSHSPAQARGTANTAALRRALARLHD